MCEHLKKETNHLKDEEKSYVVFYWMCQNIKYDVQGYLSGNRQVEPEQTYRNGYSVCSGYSRLNKHIGIFIGLNIICVSGYVKGIGFKVGEKISGTNH